MIFQSIVMILPRFFFRFWKAITKSLGKNLKIWGKIRSQEHAEQVCQISSIVQAVKKLNSISWLNFQRRPILCTTLYRNSIQASNFGGTFDQLVLWLFLCSHKMPLYLFYTLVQKSQKWPKTQIKGFSGQNEVFLSPFNHRTTRV